MIAAQKPAATKSITSSFMTDPSSPFRNLFKREKYLGDRSRK
jgi:hypothetical protein